MIKSIEILNDGVGLKDGVADPITFLGFPIQIVEWDKIPKNSICLMGEGYCTWIENVGPMNVPEREDSPSTPS